MEKQSIKWGRVENRFFSFVADVGLLLNLGTFFFFKKKNQLIKCVIRKGAVDILPRFS